MRRQWLTWAASAATVAGICIPALVVSILAWVHSRYPESLRGPGLYAFMGGGPFQLWMLAGSFAAGGVLLALGALLKWVSGNGFRWRRLGIDLLAVVVVLAALALPRFLLPTPPGPEARTGAERNFARYAADQVWSRLTAPYDRIRMGPLSLREAAEVALLVWVTGWRVTDIAPVPGECGVRGYRGWDVGSYRGTVLLHGPFGLPWRRIPFACPEDGAPGPGAGLPSAGSAPPGGESAGRHGEAAEVQLRAAGREAYRGEPVVLLRPVAYIAVRAPDDIVHVRLELARPGEEARPVARFFAVRRGDAWVFLWEDPPAEPHRLTVLGLRANGEWVTLGRVLVKGIEPGTGVWTGVLTRPVPDAAELEEVVRRYFDLTARALRRGAGAGPPAVPAAQSGHPRGGGPGGVPGPAAGARPGGHPGDAATRQHQVPPVHVHPAGSGRGAGAAGGRVYGGGLRLAGRGGSMAGAGAVGLLGLARMALWHNEGGGECRWRSV